MFFRVSLSCLLIAVGVLSPWLVRDWLDWRADERAANRFYDAVSTLPEKVRTSVGGERGGSAGKPGPGLPGPGLPETASTAGGAEIESYPLASRTMRLLQGFLPNGGAGGGSRLPFLNRGADMPVSNLSRAVAEATVPGIGERLEKLGLQLGDPVFVRVFKEEHELELWMRGEGDEHYTLFRVYRIVGRSGSLGPKRREGDAQAPEGFYYVSPSRMRPETRHHLGFDIGFPNDYDRHHERTGSDILVHGGGTSAGSFALAPESMNEIYTIAEAALREGQPFFRVNAFPFRMTDRRMEEEWKRQPEWISFWANLKEGYDFFENVNLPPDVSVEAGDYRFRIDPR